MIKYPPKPMRGWPNTSLHTRLINDPEWIVEPKINGERCIVQSGRWKNANGSHTVKLWTRKCNEITGVSQALQDILSEIMNGIMYLDGELINKSTLWLFDIPSLPYPLKDRRNRLTEFYEYRTCKGDCEIVKLMPWIDKETAYENCLANGYEGVVFKNINSLYRPQPSQENEVPTWVKFKEPGKW